MNFITDDLQRLRAMFQVEGHDLWIVGGAVRDWLGGKLPSDVDIATSATPEEQIALYERRGVRYHETGLQHGTLTVVLGTIPYEITTLRTESEHDGRWAKTNWTRDLLADLARRDLTINAMALTFDGVLVDPHGGAADLTARRVRFVGDPEQRMQEDYLRILRWLRFHGRINPTGLLDEAAMAAARKHGPGLRGISRERIWSEVSRILEGEGGAGLVERMLLDLNLGEPIGLPMGSLTHLHEVGQRTRDPVTILACYLGTEGVAALAEAWKWSTEERKRGAYVARWLNDDQFDAEVFIARDGHPREHAAAVMRARGKTMDADDLLTWDIPIFPVNGADLIERGFKPGPQMGRKLAELRDLWAESRFEISKAKLIGPL